MKAKITLLKINKDKQNRFPVCVELVHKQQRKRKTIAYALPQNWDFENNQLLKTHPFFNVLHPVILDYKSKIFKVNLGNYNFDDAVNVLFDNVKAGDTFYNLALTLVDDSTNGKLYQTVLNSFNAFAPGIVLDAITPDKAEKYMQTLLKTNRANGVHTYMRTLTAIYSKLSTDKNPFTGIRPKKVVTAKKCLSEDDLKKLIYTRTLVSKYDKHNTTDTVNYPRYYWMLLFYLGGIDFVDLANLRYDKHVVNGRLQFNRFKGGTDAFINNLIPDPAWEILSLFDCKPYLVPIYKYQDYNSYLNKCNKYLNDRTIDLQLSKKPLSKSARATFIDRAQQLLIDERITMEIVGHTQQTVHSIYTDEFPLHVRDEAHLKIIEV